MPVVKADKKNSSDANVSSRKLKKKLSRKKAEEEYSSESNETQKDKKNAKSFASTVDLFRYANKLDIFLMITGSICGLGLAGTQVLWLRTYMYIVNSFVDFGKTSANSTNSTEKPDMSDFANRIAKKAVAEFVGFGILNVALVFFCTLAWSTVADRQVYRIRKRLFNNIIKQEIGWFDSKTPGDLLNRIVEDVQTIRNGIGEKIADSFVMLARAVGGIVMAFVSGWKMTLVFFSFVPLIGVAMAVIITATKRFTMMEVDAFAKSSAIASEVLGGIKTVTAFGGQNKDVKRYEESLVDARKTGIRKGLYIGVGQMFIGIFMFSAFAVLIWYGPLLVRNEPHNYDPGAVMVVFFGVLGSTFSLGTVAPNLQYIMEASAAGCKIFEIIDRKSEIDPTLECGEKPSTIDGNIKFTQVNFSYPCRKEVKALKDVDLEIAAGKTTALVGPSGCGKSTVVQLIQRLYDVDSGQVTIDGKNVKDLNIHWLRSQMGIVSQEPVLFYGTIEENIRLGKENATFDEIKKCAIQAYADDFIMKLPKGYDTLIGEQGTTLSGGQKQRIAIARAILSNPPILLLDEATSALDTESEKAVQRALDAVGKNRTTVTIAHRLSTIQDADVIYVLSEGKVVERWEHEQLKNITKGLYFDLLTAQMAEKTREKPQPRNFSKYRIISSKVDLFSDMENSEKSADEDDLAETPTHVKRARKITNASTTFAKRKWKRRIQERMIAKLNDYKIILTVFQYNMKEWPFILAGFIFIVVVAASMPVFVVFFTELFEIFTADYESQIKKSRNLAIGMFFVGVFNGISSFISSYSLERSGTELTNRMRVKCFNAMLFQDMEWFDLDSNRVGALLTRLSIDVSQMKGMTGQRISVLIQSIASILISLIMCFVYSWELTLVTLCLFPLMVFSGYIQGSTLQKKTVQKTIKKKKSASSSLEEEGGKVASEVLNNIRTVVSLGLEQVFVERFNHFFDLQFKTRRVKNLKFAIGNSISQSMMFFMYALAFGYGAHLVQIGRVDFFLVFRIVGLIGMLGMSIGRSSVFLVDFADARESACNVIQLVNQKPMIDARSDDGLIPENAAGDIKFINVSFVYPTRPSVPVLNDLSFSAPAGKTCALVGSSGCGKSTTVGLILRFYDVNDGAVTMDNLDVRNYNIQWLRSIIGFVQQEPVLFNISIMENVKYGLPDNATCNVDDVMKACKLANIHDDILKLPMGYETRVGSRGSQLSGGQKQRIAIARALIRNPKILLLDEATSALDTTSEKVVQAALDEAQLGRTTITIAHRLSTIKDAHQIFAMNHGIVVEHGIHAELMSRNGLYANLARAQISAKT